LDDALNKLMYKDIKGHILANHEEVTKGLGGEKYKEVLDSFKTSKRSINRKESKEQNNDAW
jgi:hypothetical protein